MKIKPINIRLPKSINLQQVKNYLTAKYEYLKYKAEDANVIMVAFTVGAMAFLVVIIGIVYSSITSYVQQKDSTKYLQDIQTLLPVSNNEAVQYLQNSFENCNNPVFKAFFGIKLINMLLVNNSNIVEVQKILESMIKIRGLPDYIANIARVELANIYLRSGDKTETQILALVNNIGKNDPFYPIANEVKADILLVKNDLHKYLSVNQRIISDDQITARMKARLLSLQYVVSNKLANDVK
jgi:hypothetical protein